MFFGGFGIFSLLWDILIIWIFIAIIRKIFFHDKFNSDFKSKNRPLEILKRRYAKGKITKKQFDEMKKDIS
jgi:putative membrane protein